MPLGEVLGAEHDSPLYNTSANRDVFYAESWALTHYLLIGDPAKRPQLFAFLDRLGAGAPVEQACREGFGMPVSAMENELRGYVQQLTFPAQIVTFAEPIASRASAPGRVLSESAVDARLGDFLMNMGRREEAEARLQKALAANPHETVALLSLGELRFRQERESDALEYLARAASLDQNSYEAQWAYGRALLRRVSGPPTAAVVEQARAACARALELRPDSADAMGGLALAYLAAGERLDDARRLAERAAQLDPSEPTHVLLLAQVLASQRNFAAARAALGPLLGSPRPEIRDQARALMSRIVTYESSAARPPDKETAASGSKLVPLLRPVKEGEERAFGSLERIECGPTGNVLVVKAGDRVLRLSVPRTHAMDFISYRDDLRGDVSCGARKPPDPVYVTWTPAPPGPAGLPDGEAVAVEFVPKDYVPKTVK